jgi:hypothetical protein
MTPEEILEIHRNDIIEYFDDVKEVYKKTCSVIKGIFLQDEVLYHCVESLFLDIYRIRAFHGIEIIDSHKKAAFTMKWVSKLRPISIDKNYKETNYAQVRLTANDYFAVQAGIWHLNVDFDLLFDCHKDFIKNLIYTLHNRYVTGEILSSMMYLIEKLTFNETKKT